ncbi:hypothetical protein MIMGU_mgv1a016822mg [Erythranthe guttata]|uniref:Uncharacterized protein n=1 Tax=Erythranthe guttata TaxID=4155 RepID=A0A022PRH3_ERYGU|nr:hypothetical protein MIMGU_mgv1a016822mg [Erythranthe guttata]
MWAQSGDGISTSTRYIPLTPSRTENSVCLVCHLNLISHQLIRKILTRIANERIKILPMKKTCRKQKIFPDNVCPTIVRAEYLICKCRGKCLRLKIMWHSSGDGQV